MVGNPANSINQSGASGIQNFNGTSAFSTTSLTEYNVLTGNTSDSVNNVAPTASGAVLTSNGVSAQPSFQALIPSFSWNVVTASSQSCIVDNGYIGADASVSAVNMYLPATAAVGNEIRFANIESGFTVIPSPGQTISFLAQSVSTPFYFQTSAGNAAMDLVCTNANTSWNVINNEGTFNLATTYNAYNSVSMGASDLYFLLPSITAWSTGSGTGGSLGNNTTTGVSSPVQVTGPFSFTNVANGYNTNTDFAIALNNDGTCWGWGINTDGQLGNQTTTSYSSPVSVVGALSFISLCASNNASYGLQANGQAWAWGVNASGQLGNQTRTNTSSPISIVGGFSFVQVAAGAASAYGLLANGSVWGWGDNSQGQLGNQTGTSYSSPISVVGGFSFIQIAAGFESAYGLMSNGQVWGWGYNLYGQLGNDSTTATSSPVSVVGGFSFIQISAGFRMAYGLLANGQVWAWGDNTGGKLGNNATATRSSPVSVVGGISFAGLVNLNAESTSGSAFSSTGLWAWGGNATGQLGNNTLTNYSSPILVLNGP